MKTLGCSIIAALLLIPTGAVAGAPGSGVINYRANATFSDGTSADRLYSVTVADIDGDGVDDEAWLRVACAEGAVTTASYYSVKSPRDTASGLATGKRMHRPFTIRAELDRTASTTGKNVSWDIKEAKGAKAATGGNRPTYDVKKVEGTGARTAVTDGKTMASDDWHEASIRDGSPELCK